MSLNYRTLLIENLGNKQKRYMYAYEIIGVGTILNTRVTLTIDAPQQNSTHQNIVDKEIFIPNITYNQLTNINFINIDTLHLEKSQKRIVRKYTLPTGAAIISIVHTVEYKEGTELKTLIRDEELYYHPSAAELQIFQHKTPQGNWISGTQIDFTSRPGYPTTNNLILPDGYPRSFTGTLNWTANTIGNLGWDSSISRDSGDGWIWWYVVPNVGDNTSLTIIASNNPPNIKPRGFPIFKTCWVTYRNSGVLRRVRQINNHFHHTFINVYNDSNISSENNYSMVSLLTSVPNTASVAQLYHRAIIEGTQATQDRWYCRIGINNYDSDIVDLIDIRSPWDTQRTPREITSIASEYIPSVPHTIAAVNQTTRNALPSYYMHNQESNFEAPLFYGQTLYKKRYQYAGSQNTLYGDELYACGWIDEWIEP